MDIPNDLKGWFAYTQLPKYWSGIHYYETILYDKFCWVQMCPNLQSVIVKLFNCSQCLMIEISCNHLHNLDHNHLLSRFSGRFHRRSIRRGSKYKMQHRSPTELSKVKCGKYGTYAKYDKCIICKICNIRVPGSWARWRVTSVVDVSNYYWW